MYTPYLLYEVTACSTYSPIRFPVLAAEHNIPFAILNIGPTRADHLAALKVEARIGDILPLVVSRIGQRR